jgi:hypothetical protein
MNGLLLSLMLLAAPPPAAPSRAPVPGFSTRIEAEVVEVGDGAVLVRVEVPTPATKRAAEKGGAFVVRARNQVRHMAIHGDHLYLLYPVVGGSLSTAVLEAKIGKKVKLVLIRTESGQHMVKEALGS